MKYYKIVENGYILLFGTNCGGTEITREEYDELQEVFQSRPIPEAGYDYRLKEDLTWEQYEVPTDPEPVEEDAGEEDYQNALEEFGVNFDEEE